MSSARRGIVYVSRVTRSPSAGAVARLAAWRRTRPRTPPLTRRTVTARGLPFAVWSTPEVPGATPLLAINGGMIYGHDLLWPALAPLAEGRQVILYDQRHRRAARGARRPSHRLESRPDQHLGLAEAGDRPTDLGPPL